MPGIQKNNLTLSFGQGLDTKTDPWQVAAGKMLALQNAVFTKGGLFQKRNGFGALVTLSNTTSTNLTTYDDNLIALGTSLQALSADTSSWLSKGVMQPLTLSVTPVVRTSTNITTVDMAIAPNGVCCVTYLDGSGNCYYQVVDSETGQILVGVTQLPATSTFSRVFSLGNYLVITFLATVSAATHLQYIAIPSSNPSNPGAATDISTVVKDLTAGYDGYVSNNNLYLAFNASDGGGAVRVTYIDSILNQHTTVAIAGKTADLMSVTADETGSTPVIWVTFWDTTSNNGFTKAYNQILVSAMAITQIITGVELLTLTTTAVSGVMRAFYQINAVYSGSAIRSDTLTLNTCTIAGVAGTAAAILRGVGLASKAFYFSPNSKSYMLVAYGGSLQPTYFMIDQAGSIVAKFAYSNGGGYATNQVLPGVHIDGDTVTTGYLFRDQLTPVNKSQGVTTTVGFYAQKGINLVNFSFNNSDLITSEIANDLHMTAGFLWMYDGVAPVEHGFFVYPEDIQIATATGAGDLVAQQYYYAITYEWTDAKGNIHRSAPSVPTGIVTTTASSTNTLKIPTLRLTSKTGNNPVRIVIYRWSTAQQAYYQITSVTSPKLNTTSADIVTYVDTAADSAILGNLILYTSGGVVENISAPCCTASTLFKSRLFLIDAEDENLLWYSKQVIEGVPVEMSDLFTLFVAPTLAAQGSTGPMRCTSSLDDKLIIFKQGAIYYITGSGPDNTGANNDFSDPVFITSTVGCSNQKSIVFIPTGLMFQSDKGIWLLGRDLSTTYIGAPVEMYNDTTVLSAVTVPGTNQVRITLDNGVTLMYDYFFNQWGTFNNVPAISSTIYQDKHTYLNSYGQVFQETVGTYLDGAKPVLMSFTTAWIHLAGLQGYQRIYFLYLLGQYLTPHKLNIQIAYDYDPAIRQTNLITPDNFNDVYGSDPLYGSTSPYGGASNVEQWRMFLDQQKCEAFQITLTEVFDNSFGVPPGAGFTLSGLNLVVGAKSSYPRLQAANAVG